MTRMRGNDSSWSKGKRLDRSSADRRRCVLKQQLSQGPVYFLFLKGCQAWARVGESPVELTAGVGSGGARSKRVRGKVGTASSSGTRMGIQIDLPAVEQQKKGRTDLRAGARTASTDRAEMVPK